MKKFWTYYVEVFTWVLIAFAVYAMLESYAQDAYGLEPVMQLAWFIGAGVGSLILFPYYILVIKYARKIRWEREQSS